MVAQYWYNGEALLLCRYKWPGGTPRTEANCTETYCIYDKIWCVLPQLLNP